MERKSHHLAIGEIGPSTREHPLLEIGSNLSLGTYGRNCFHKVLDSVVSCDMFWTHMVELFDISPKVKSVQSRQPERGKKSPRPNTILTMTSNT